jgi:hypothetical protein
MKSGAEEKSQDFPTKHVSIHGLAVSAASCRVDLSEYLARGINTFY